MYLMICCHILSTFALTDNVADVFRLYFRNVLGHLKKFADHAYAILSSFVMHKVVYKKTWFSSPCPI